MPSLFNWQSRIASTTSGITSTLSSSLVISIILRCHEGLSSPYHRIMFFMSIWDLIASICIALTIIPMPADVLETYPFPGKAFGNKTTCQLQGFFILLGQGFGICANCVLNMFYVSTIRYGMSEATINRWMLPIALIVSSLLAIPTGLVSLSLGLINPTPYELYCSIGTYPTNCNRQEDMECIGKDVDPKAEDMMFLVVLMLLLLCFLSVIVSLILVVMTVYRFDKMTKQLIKEIDQGEGNGQQEDSDHLRRLSDSSQTSRRGFSATKAAGRVALMYVFAFFLTYFWTIISMLPIGDVKGIPTGVWDVIAYARTIFFPLQGFFNALIFVYNKMTNLRRASSEDISFIEAFKMVIQTPSVVTPAKLISCLDLVEKDLGEHESIPNFSGGDESKWKDFGSRTTPNISHYAGVSQTNMDKEVFEKREELDSYSSPERKYYSNVIVPRTLLSEESELPTSRPLRSKESKV